MFDMGLCLNNDKQKDKLLDIQDFLAAEQSSSKEIYGVISGRR